VLGNRLRRAVEGHPVVLSDPTAPATQAEATVAAGGELTDVRELLARLQIGHAEAKHRAVDGLLDALRENEESVLSALGRGNVAALVQLLTATAPKVREKGSDCPLLARRVRHSGGGRNTGEERGHNCHFLLLYN